eukprot:CAMPEP_0197295886 /NCGR_PEP_ID=MMETSP0890-20130614/36815_1 /TAXON_ID=44058 ORGANISM="Aureoumbra lagunensis, Strain CCMP1510" /NCGR_SAMPLE_ID=MMETSP0890 /ASSEMBLY_ACC=CAM_ASM_000533 /LENGTH=320 /DNA_ID=CAMNT_0042772117 /DNA_START=151 /DNA_END=1113 /DNA_ORIENTATION=+
MVVPLTEEKLGINSWAQREIGSKFQTFDETLELRPRLRGIGAEPMVLGIMESKDITTIARLLAECFSTLKISNEVYAPWENAALRGVAKLTNAYDVTEYSIGLRVRCGDRIHRPLDAIKADDPGSLVFTVARAGSKPQAVGALELRIRDTDGTAPAALPFLDRLRPENKGLNTGNKMGIPNSIGPRPYISCLCVSSACRRRGIAAALLSVAEHFAGPAVWGYDSVFLHVQASNHAALELYKNAGYTYIPLRQDEDEVFNNDFSSRAQSHQSSSDLLTFLYKPLRDDAPDADTIARCLRESSSSTTRLSIRRTFPLLGGGF